MSRSFMLAGALCAAVCSTVALAQSARVIPRPPAQAPGPPRPEDGSAAPDGYQPLPQWLGQTRAPAPPAARTAAYTVETFAQGISGPFSFNVLPDGRLIVAERGGHIKLVGKDGRLSEIEGLPSTMWARAGQGAMEARPDRAFATNRTLYVAYTVLPEGTNPASPPRAVNEGPDGALYVLTDGSLKPVDKGVDWDDGGTILRLVPKK
jgi:glucose/arabinose dehydrogenase